MTLQNDLWDYALQLYGQPGVEQACLEIQQGWPLGINRLLFCCWLATEGRSLQPRQLKTSAAAHWQQSITAPLRALRYQVREQARHEPELGPCYRALRQAELACEQVELARLFTLGRDWRVSAGARPDDLVLDNIRQYLRLEGVAPDAGLLAVLQIVLQAAVPDLAAERVRQLRW
jgi:uncharacterized protein (TIGR02444 family)